MVPMFEIAAKKFVEKNNGNAMHALAKALAYISGNTSASTSG